MIAAQQGSPERGPRSAGRRWRRSLALVALAALPAAGAAQAQSGVAYYTPGTGNELAMADFVTGEKTVIKEGVSIARAIALTADGTKLYQAEVNGELSEFDLVSDEVRRVAEGLLNVRGLALEPAAGGGSQRTAYVTTDDSGGSLLAVDLETGDSNVVVSGLYQPLGLAVHPQGNRAYVGLYSGGIAEVHLASRSVTLLQATASHAALDVVLNDDASVAYFLSQDFVVRALDLTSSTLKPWTWFVGWGWTGSPLSLRLVMGPDGQTPLFALGDNLYALDPESPGSTLLWPLPGHEYASPGGLALSPNGRTLFYAQYSGWQLASVDLVDGNIQEDHQDHLLRGPSILALDPASDAAIVKTASSYGGSPQLSRLDLTTGWLTGIRDLPVYMDAIVTADHGTLLFTRRTESQFYVPGDELVSIPTDPLGAETILAAGLELGLGMALDPAEGTVYTVTFNTPGMGACSGFILSIERATGVVTTVASGLCVPRGVAVSGDATKLYFSDVVPGMNLLGLWEVDLSSGGMPSLVHELEGVGHIRHLCLSSDGKLVYLSSDSYGGSLYQVDLSSGVVTRLATGLGDVYRFVVLNTAQPGVPVAVTDPVSGLSATVTFSAVTAPGETTVSATTTAPPLPAGFELEGTYYDVSTTATTGGDITVCLPHGAGFPDPTLQLWHGEDTDGDGEADTWVDVTTDRTDTVICGTVTSLSPFVIVSFTALRSLIALAEEVDALRAGHVIPPAVANSLLAKLDGAVAALADSNPANDHVAVNRLEAFIHQVEAQRGHRIPEAEADALIAAAQEILDALLGA